MKQIVCICMALLFVNSAIAQVVTDEIIVHLTHEGGMVKAELVVEDFLGRKTGRDPLTETRYKEIPNASYGDTGVDSHDPNVPGIYALEFGMRPTAKGIYTIKVIGTGTDTFKLFIVMSRFRDGVEKGADFSFTGTTSYGQVTEYRIYYDPDPTKTLSAELIIKIDIKPGSDPNSINCKNRNGVIPVAILTTDTFDATSVDPLSVRFGRTGTEASETHNKGHIEDADGDGDLDMVLHFRFGDTGIQCGDTEAILTGQTNDGMQIRGTDAIQTVGQ